MRFERRRRRIELMCLHLLVRPWPLHGCREKSGLLRIHRGEDGRPRAAAGVSISEIPSHSGSRPPVDDGYAQAVMDFRVEVLQQRITQIKPAVVWIGYDSRNCGLVHTSMKED